MPGFQSIQTIAPLLCQDCKAFRQLRPGFARIFIVLRWICWPDRVIASFPFLQDGQCQPISVSRQVFPGMILCTARMLKPLFTQAAGSKQKFRYNQCIVRHRQNNPECVAFMYRMSSVLSLRIYMPPSRHGQYSPPASSLFSPAAWRSEAHHVSGTCYLALLLRQYYSRTFNVTATHP